jgi:hypothetical protein
LGEVSWPLQDEDTMRVARFFIFLLGIFVISALVYAFTAFRTCGNRPGWFT